MNTLQNWILSLSVHMISDFGWNKLKPIAHVSAWSCLKGVATHQFTPPPHSNSNTPGTASFCSHVIYYDNSARDNMLYGTSRTFNIIQNFGDPLKTTTRRSTTISTGESVKQEQMCKSLTSNAEQSEDVCHDFA